MLEPRWCVLRLFVAIAACANLSVFDSLAQSYPVKPIYMVVGYVAGGGVDTVAHRVSQKLRESFGQPVVVDNRPGASGSIANDRVAKSPADGYTLLMMSGGSTILPFLRPNLPYDLQRDLAPISLVAIGTGVLVVHPSVPVSDVKGLIGLARSHPGKLNFGSSGIGSFTHIAGELFNLIAKVKVVHVPYKGTAEVVIGLASGQVDMSFGTITSALGLLNAGKLKALAVTSAKRSSLMPAMPTLHESGLPGYDRYNWFGVLAPARVPKDIVVRLNSVIGKVVNTPEMRESFNKDGLEVQTTTPDEFAAFIQQEMAQNARVIKAVGVKAE